MEATIQSETLIIDCVSTANATVLHERRDTVSIQFTASATGDILAQLNGQAQKMATIKSWVNEKDKTELKYILTGLLPVAVEMLHSLLEPEEAAKYFLHLNKQLAAVVRKHNEPHLMNGTQRPRGAYKSKPVNA